MTINTDLKDYLILNIINSDNWTLKSFGGYPDNKIVMTLPINNEIKLAIFSLFPEVEKYFQHPFPYDTLSQISFQFNGYTFFLVREEDKFSDRYFYLTKEAV